MTAGAVARDVLYGLRMIRRRPLSSAAAIATLAVGIGLNAAVFSVADWVLFRPLPYPAPGELVKIFTAGAAPLTAPAPLTYSEFEAFAAAKTLRTAAAISTATRIVAAPGIDPTHRVIARVGGDLFATLGMHPDRGRGFSAGERASGAPVAVLSDAFARQLPDAATAAGRVVTIDGRPYTIVGVMPPNLGYPRDVDLWTVLTATDREDDDREHVGIARMSPDVTVDRASAELATVATAISKGSRTAWVEDLQHADVRDSRTAVMALVAAAGLILLIACANVAALLGTRRADRAAELATRGALGASRWRLFQQVLTETVLIAIAGGTAGVLLGGWTLDLLVRLAPPTLPRLAEIALDTRVIVVAAAATCLVGLLVGFVPAYGVSRASERSFTRAPARRRYAGVTGRHLAVAVQTAMAVVVAVGAGLLARSLQHLVTIDHGFNPSRLVAIDLSLRGGPPRDTRQLFSDLIATASATPGVRSAAAGLRRPHELASLRVPVVVPGAPAATPTTITLRPVTPGYFATVGIPLVAGRDFAPTDRRPAPGVAIVNSAFVREVLAGGRTIGTNLTMDLFKGELTIVGHVAEVTPAGEADRPALYVSADQVGLGGGTLLVRLDRDPERVLPSLIARLKAAAPGLPLDRVNEIEALLAGGRAATRFNALLASIFAGLALLLAAIGVYGLTASEVASRWRELAVRLALGASHRRVFWTAVRPGSAALIAGLAIGVASALIASRWMAPLLRGVAPTDPATLIAVPLLLALAGVAAAFSGAARIVRADPAPTLRE